MRRLILVLSIIFIGFSLSVSANVSRVTDEMYQEYLQYKKAIDKAIAEGAIIPPQSKDAADIGYLKPGEKMPRFLAHDERTGQDIPNPYHPQVGDASNYWDRQNITNKEMFKNEKMIKNLGIIDPDEYKDYWNSPVGKSKKDEIIRLFLNTREGKDYKAAIESGKQTAGKEFTTIEAWLHEYALFGISVSNGVEVCTTLTIGRTESWYKTYAMFKEITPTLPPIKEEKEPKKSGLRPTGIRGRSED